MVRPLASLALAVLASSAAPDGASQRRVLVRTSAELSAALTTSSPGTTIALAPGVYESGIFLRSLSGTARAPITIEAADPDDRPVVRGGDTGIQMSDVAHVILRRVVVEGARWNGINIDDGETIGTPSHHVTLSEITVRDIRDGGGVTAGIKLSGVQDFVVEDSRVESWGGGSAITVIGGHRGVIRRSTFRHRDDAGATGLQIKGGSTDIVVRENRFEHAGLRAVQIGGTTDRRFFRPQPPAPYEAAACTIEHNVFVGSEAVVAFVTADGSVFRHNTIYRPRKWLLRILQETSDPAFVRSRRGELSRNVIYFHGDDFPIGAVNVGAGTEAGSFRFVDNWWFRADRPNASRQALPSQEIGGVYGRDPRFADADDGDFRHAADSAATGYGARHPR